MKSLQRAGILVLMMALLIVAVGAVGAQDYPPGTLTVTGFGQAFGAPDVVLVQLGVQTSSSDIMEAYTGANTTIQKVIDALTAMGIDAKDIQTTGLNLYQDNPYDPQTGQPSDKITYHVQNSLNITVRDVSKAGDVIDTGVQAGANNIGGVTFSIADPAALEQQAREAAVEDARTRAQHLADLMGVELGSPSIIVEGSGSSQPPVAFARAELAVGGGGATIQQGQLSVSMQVQVTLNIQ